MKTHINPSDLLIPCGVFIFVAVLFISSLATYGYAPTRNSSAQNNFIVEQGQSFNSIIDKLTSEGLVKHKLKFKLLAHIKGYDKSIKSGEYILSANMTPLQILNTLETGRVKLCRLTIPEGYNIRQIAQLVDAAGICSEEKFFSTASNNFPAQKMLSFKAESFEGYLFPDTYFFSANMEPKKIISAMLERFNKVFSEKWKKRAEKIGFTIHQIVTLASIIEKETGAPEERPIISSVFHNRLKKRMRLETDPTVIYGLKNFNGNLTRKDLNTPAPYNTYKIRGLPPGPIANPGIESLKAALYPDTTPYLYFVSKKNGTHEFSTNIQAHNEAVLKYQLNKR